MLKVIRELTEAEELRMIEIEFYLFVNNLLNNYNRSFLISDIIESFSELFRCNTTILKKLCMQVYTGYGAIVPSKQELCVLLYKYETPIRKIRKLTGSHPQTVYRYLDEYVEEGQFEFNTHLTPTETEEVKKFMEQIKTITDWR